MTDSIFSLFSEATVAYVASHYIVEEANRIFGQDAWSSEVKELVEDYVRERNGISYSSIDFLPSIVTNRHLFPFYEVYRRRATKILSGILGLDENNAKKWKIRGRCWFWFC